MLRLLTSAFAAILLLSAPLAQAGGPVIVEDDVEVVADQSSSIGILPLILVAVAVCAALCGNDEPEVDICQADISC